MVLNIIYVRMILNIIYDRMILNIINVRSYLIIPGSLKKSHPPTCCHITPDPPAPP